MSTLDTRYRRFAVLSDVHGNLFALRAALADAERQGAEFYLFLGDYFNDFPFHNEVAELLRSVEPSALIGGNKEERLAYAPTAGWEDSLQMRPLMDAGWTLTPENFAFLTELPTSLDLAAPDGSVMQLRHASPLMFRAERLHRMHSSEYNSATHAEYERDAIAEIRSRADVMAELDALPERCIHLFGHNHLQFHAEIDGRLLLNPGSCGMPINRDNRAQYSLLTFGSGGRAVEERRVEYDVDAATGAIRAWCDRIGAPQWADSFATQVRTGVDCASPFMRNLYATAERFGGSVGGVVSNSVWNASSFDVGAVLRSKGVAVQ